MLRNPVILATFFLVLQNSAFAQGAPTPASAPSQPFGEIISNMATDVSRLAGSVDKLTINWKSFFEAFSTNQGLRLSPAQQRILLALEVLNRSEQRLANLQKMRMELIEKQSAFRLQLARINDELVPENVDRSMNSRGGTLNAEQARDNRRQALMRERLELSNVLNQIQSDLASVNDEIRETERLIASIRRRLFPQVERELDQL